MSIHTYVQQVPWALQMVYRERPYQIAAVVLGMLAAVVVSWAMQMVSYIPESGLFWDITPMRLIEVLTLSSSIGLLIPMQVYVLRKHKKKGSIIRNKRTTSEGQKASTSRLLSFAPGLSGGLGAVLGIACLTCCAPLLFPALLALFGATGSAILTLNTRLVQWSGLLFLGSLVLCGVTLLLFARNVTAACALPPASDSKEQRDREDHVPARTRTQP